MSVEQRPEIEALYGEGQSREFNRYTLTGQWDPLFFALLRERMAEDGLDPESELEAQFRAHLSRGVLSLYQRVKNVADLADLVAEAQRRAAAGRAEAETHA